MKTLLLCFGLLAVLIPASAQAQYNDRDDMRRDRMERRDYRDDRYRERNRDYRDEDRYRTDRERRRSYEYERRPNVGCLRVGGVTVCD